MTPDVSMTLEEAVERTETLVTAAVHRQMESDVPIGEQLIARQLHPCCRGDGHSRFSKYLHMLALRR